MKKVLSFVLVLSLVLGSFSMAFAATPTKSGLSDVKGNANEDAIQVAYDLGIVTGNPDGTYLPAKAVTRAEFSAMITRALAIPDSALAGYKTSKFADTNGYGWAVPYLAFSNSKGIMLGDGAGNAMPGKTITVNEAITMVLRAIGYTSNSSELVGVWPANYVTKAQELSLYDDVQKDALGVDKANAAQIIYNALTVQKVAVNSDGKTEYLWDNKDKKDSDRTTLLTAGLNCTAYEDQIVGKGVVTYANSAINIVNMLGAHGTAYQQKSGDKKVVAFTKKDSVALVGHMDGDKFKVGDTKYTFDTKTDIVTTHAAILNGEDATSATSTIGAIEDKTNNGDVIINVDLSGKTIKSVWSIVGWATDGSDMVTASDLKAIEDKELLGSKFPKNDNDDIDLNGFELVGAKSLSDIKADNVVYIYEEGGNGDIRKIAVGQEVITGTVEEVDDHDITVNGKVYTVYDPSADVVPAGANTEVPEAGDDVVLHVDAYGYVYDFDATGNAGTYAVVKGFEPKGNINNPQLKLYTSSDEDKTPYLVNEKDVTFTKVDIAANGVKVTQSALNMTYGSIKQDTIVGYGFDKNGKVNSLNLTAIQTDLAQMTGSKVIKVKNNAGVAKTYPVKSDAVVFTYDGKDYDIAKASDLKIDTDLVNADLGYAQYILDKDGKTVVAVLVDRKAATKSDNDIYAVANSLTAKNDAGDKIQRIVGLGNGAGLDKLTTDSKTIDEYSTTIGAYKLKINADGKVSDSDTYEGVNGAYVTVGAIEDVSNDGTSVQIAGVWYSLADKAYVYEATTKDSNSKVDLYKTSNASSLRKSTASTKYVVYLFDMNTDKDHEGAEVAVFVKY